MAIVEYRRARTAIDLFNSGRDGAEQLGKRPDLTNLLLEIAKAQDSETELEHVYGTLKAQQADTDESDEEDD